MPFAAMPFAATNIGGLKKRSDADTIIIWDWDDTLLCSDDIISGGYADSSGLVNGGGPIPELEGLIEKCLKISMSLGETIIVTNAGEDWLWDTARRFVPRCLSLLSQVPILSARDKYQHLFPGDGVACKHETFNEIFSSRRLTYGLNLIVLGDSDCEIQAAWTSTRRMPADSLRVKTVKFKEAPTCEELCDQQKMMVDELAAIVHEEKDSNRDLAWSLRSSPSRSLSTAPLPHSCSMGDSMAHSLGQPLMLAGSSQYGGLDSTYPRNAYAIPERCRPMSTIMYVM